VADQAPVGSIVKLTLAAFEAIYRACAPGERRAFFRRLGQANPTGATITLEPPAPVERALQTGIWRSKVKLVAVADGYWSVM
jgi:hypothetical protein